MKRGAHNRTCFCYVLQIQTLCVHEHCMRVTACLSIRLTMLVLDTSDCCCRRMQGSSLHITRRTSPWTWQSWRRPSRP